MSHQSDHIDDHGLADTETQREVAPPRFKPVGREALRHTCLMCHVRALTSDGHDPALGYVPCERAGLPRSSAEVSLLEIEEIVFIEATQRSEYLRANHH